MFRANTVRAKTAFLVFAAILAASEAAYSQQFRFHLQEATIDDVHQAIRQGQITCRGLVQLYINRAKAYNGVADELVTKDGASIPPAPGVVRLGAPLKFPTATVAISTLLPDFDQYAGPPIEFGRMEPTASDPTVQQQYGMTIGMPNAGQLNALGTINLRGERSVTCKGDRDRRPSDGPLPSGSPAVCEEFRKQPDALERAAELDAQYGRNPDLQKMPMYCVVFTFKDSYDAKDMRSTGGADANYDIDFPARDQTLVAQLREKGAIIYAKAVNTEYNGRPVPAIRGDEARRARLKQARPRFSSPPRVINAAVGREIQAMSMTPRVRPLWGPAQARASPSARILRCAVFVKRPACPAADLPITTRCR